MEFGRNGAVLETDSQTEFEFSGLHKNDLDLCITGVVGLGAYAGLVTYLAIYSRAVLALPLTMLCLLSGFLLTIAAPAIAFATRAVDEQRLPRQPNGQPQYQHIPGSAVMVLAIALLGIVWLAYNAAQALSLKSNMEIPELWGDIVVILVAAAFLGAIIGPRLSRLSVFASIEAGLARAGSGFAPIGRAASAVDSWLVYVVAPAAGVTQSNALVRYALLLGNLIPCCVAAWFLPAPLGLLPAASALLVVTAVARRWAWVEDDRETAMLNANFARENLRIGFDEDLRDETLWSFLSLLVLIPIAMRQCNDWFGGTLFDTAAADGLFPSDSFFAWLTYYGTELAKSIPFIDWSEIYDVHSASQIAPTHPYARHVIFAARALTDLALIAAFLQALSISSRTKKQKEMFHDPHNPLDRLDPFIEPVELRKLVAFQGGIWVPRDALIATFPKYNLARLHELRAKEATDSPLRAAATALLARQYPDQSDASERLLEEANKPEPKPQAVFEALLRVRREGQYDIAILEDARRSLNRTAGFAQVRRAIVEVIVQNVPDGPERTISLRQALADPHVRDSMAWVRLYTLEPLLECWRRTQDDRIVTAIKRASDNDPSAQVRAAAKQALKAIERHPEPVA